MNAGDLTVAARSARAATRYRLVATARTPAAHPADATLEDSYVVPLRGARPRTASRSSAQTLTAIWLCACEPPAMA